MTICSRWIAPVCLLILIAPLLAAQSDPDAGLVGSRAKSLALPGLNGETVEFPKFSPGTRYNIVVFWATWNRFAALEFEDLAKRYERWRRSGVRVVGINVEGPRIGVKEKAAARKWLAEHPAAFPIAFDQDLKAFRAYGVIAVPTTFIIDDSGVIVMKVPGYPIGGASHLIRYIEMRLYEDREGGARTPTKIHSQAYRQALRNLRQARLLIRRQRHELALYTLNLAIKRDASLLDAWIELIRFHEAKGDRKSASSVLVTAKARFGKDARFIVEVARLLMSRGKTKEAESAARAALGLNPSLSSARLILGQIREKEGQAQEALKLFLQAAQQNALDPRPLLEAARIYEGQAKFQESLNFYEKAYLLLSGGQTR